MIPRIYHKVRKDIHYLIACKSRRNRQGQPRAMVKIEGAGVELAL